MYYVRFALNSFDCKLSFGLVLSMNDKKPSTEIAKTKKSSTSSEKKTVEQDANTEKEIGGFENRPEPTRFGDWDVNGRCSDF